jgi:seryl-tRNA synthetase
MLDIKLLRRMPEEMEERLRGRDPSIRLAPLLDKDGERLLLLREVEKLKEEKNSVSQQIAELKKQGKDASGKIAAMQELSRQLKGKEAALKELNDEVYQLLIRLPNIPHEDVPVSEDKNDRVVVHETGSIPTFSFPMRNHVEIARELGIIDFTRASRMSGSQFSLYMGPGARFEWALINFMLDVHVKEKGYEPVLPPLLVNAESMFTSGNLPKFEDQLYRCRDDDLYLIPTSEVSLTNLYRGEMLSEEELPLRYVSFTPCFRREAGTYGIGERGMIRIHQFNKVELYRFMVPETSYSHLQETVKDAEDILDRLELHHRTTRLVSTDIGFQSAMTYDVEIWLPGQKAYYEVSSCSNCEDFQARRGNIRYRPADGGKPRFVHTMNGSGLATSRLMVGLLETNQNEDGSVTVPPVLRPYLDGLERLEPKK